MNLSADRQCDAEMGAAGTIVDDFNAPPVRNHQLWRDRPPQTAPPHPALTAAFATIEPLEDPVTVFLRNAWAGVAHVKRYAIAVPCKRQGNCSALRRVLYGIGNQIVHNYAQFVGVGVQSQRMKQKFRMHAPSVRRELVRIEHLLDDSIQSDRRDIQSGKALLGAVIIEEILDQLLQPPPVVLQDRNGLA